ncbi:protein of unknown function [Modestobacter italicus]|uniref:Uncharacterized protein n=2 Tax=Modestobacter italicus (strain DSM 44449 / CECT 9708 / BC 501) TaxID=2732864 RepID=I4EYG3_MODI5|nr:protein of unknown function [Modestobacter marinus]
MVLIDLVAASALIIGAIRGLPLTPGHTVGLLRFFPTTGAPLLAELTNISDNDIAPQALCAGRWP